MAAVGALLSRLQRYAEQHDDDDGVENNAGLTAKQLKEAAQAVSDELVALQAIYGDECVALLNVQRTRSGSIQMTVIDDDATQQLADDVVASWDAHQQPIRLALNVELQLTSPTNDVGDAVAATSMRLSAVLPVGYPMTRSPPQLQLLSRYVGANGVDHALFGRILRIFIAPSTDGDDGSADGVADRVRFEQGQVALFDGIEKARELVERWHLEREADQKAQQHASEAQRADLKGTSPDLHTSMATLGIDQSTETAARHAIPTTAVKLITAPAITERKSTFVGHAAVLRDPNDVAAILSGLLQDRRIARATHPAIFAWVCRTDGIVHRDCDDDGEQAAGGRLAHLLDVLHVENAIVIVTRWYGGVLLGADRFKLINRAARDALEVANVVDGPLNTTTGKATACSRGRKA